MPDFSPAGGKPALRAAMAKRRACLALSEAHALSEKAQRHILADPRWKAAKSVALYSPVRGEARTDLLRREAWETGKTVLFPYVPEKSGCLMLLLPCAHEGSLISGAFGIPEPDSAACPMPPEHGWIPELVIVPGIAFDRAGNRMGSGKGFYDRLFARPGMERTIRIGLAYGFQVADAVPCDPWDIPMNALGTEEGLTWL